MEAITAIELSIQEEGIRIVDGEGPAASHTATGWGEFTWEAAIKRGGGDAGGGD